MMRRAREVMYWIGMRAAILQESANCFVCASTHTEQLAHITAERTDVVS